MSNLGIVTIGSRNAIVPLSAITDPLLWCKWGDKHRKPHSTPHFNLTRLRSWPYLFETSDPSVWFICSVMRISTLATFIVLKNTSCNFVTESEMVNLVSVIQVYSLYCIVYCLLSIHGNTDLCMYKLDFSGDLTWLILIKFLRQKLHYTKKYVSFSVGYPRQWYW